MYRLCHDRGTSVLCLQNMCALSAERLCSVRGTSVALSADHTYISALRNVCVCFAAYPQSDLWILQNVRRGGYPTIPKTLIVVTRIQVGMIPVTIYIYIIIIIIIYVRMIPLTRIIIIYVCIYKCMYNIQIKAHSKIINTKKQNESMCSQ